MSSTVDMPTTRIEPAVYGEPDLGWDAATPPNETVDEDGRPFPPDPGFGVPDPRAPARREYDHPDVVALRAKLRRSNGLRGLEICAPDEIERAARIFFRDGFVVVRDLLSPGQLDRLRRGCAGVLSDLLALPGFGGRRYLTESYRLPHRYSFGTSSASRHLMHDPHWAEVIDLPTTTPLLERLFGGGDYRVLGGGGDVCLPGAMEYQHLHWDLKDDQALTPARIDQARALGVRLKAVPGSEMLSVRSQRLVMEHTPPVVTVNFLMSDLTWENGPIRQIPGTHALQQRPPRPGEEPDWMRWSTLVGAPAGAGVFRDTRAWHGGTPNLSREVRAMPNIEYAAPWVPAETLARSMPHEIWQTLPPRAQRLCRYITTAPGEWPAGAGVNHPLISGRRAAQQDPRPAPKRGSP